MGKRKKAKEIKEEAPSPSAAIDIAVANMGLTRGLDVLNMDLKDLYAQYNPKREFVFRDKLGQAVGVIQLASIELRRIISK